MILAESWSDVFNNLTGVLTVTFLFGGWIIVAIVSSITKNWRKVQESEHQAALKQSMIERGMSADEIERVLRAGPPTMESNGGDGDTTQLSKKLAEHDVPAPVMEQILGAFHSADAGTRKTLASTVEAMLDGGANSEQVVAAVRAMSKSNTVQTHDVRYRDDPASFRH